MIIRVDSVSGLKSFRETQPERLSSPRVARESTASTLVSPPESTTPEQGVSESTPPPLYRGWSGHSRPGGPRPHNQDQPAPYPLLFSPMLTFTTGRKALETRRGCDHMLLPIVTDREDHRP